MQIESVSFKNFKVLRDTTLPLSRMTLLIGPNGSGKSTAFEGLEFLRRGSVGPHGCDPSILRSLGAAPSGPPPAISAHWLRAPGGWESSVTLENSYRVVNTLRGNANNDTGEMTATLRGIRSFAFDARALRQGVQLQASIEMSTTGYGLAVVLDRIRDEHPERFERLNEELPLWFPEYDHVLFDTPMNGSRAVALRMSANGGRVTAECLSEGTMLALGMLTLAHLPSPPLVVCIEEPDRGVHPRLLRNIHDALTRLAHPEASGDNRPAVQVIATTHSPYFLDLFRDHPEDIVIAERESGEAKFHRLMDRPDLKELLEDASLGDIWYSGVLGGVPSSR